MANWQTCSLSVLQHTNTHREAASPRCSVTLPFSIFFWKVLKHRCLTVQDIIQLNSKTIATVLSLVSKDRTFHLPLGLGVRQASHAVAAGWLMSVQSWQAQSSSSFLATLSLVLLQAQPIRLFRTGSLLNKQSRATVMIIMYFCCCEFYCAKMWRFHRHTFTTLLNVSHICIINVTVPHVENNWNY